MSATHYPAIKFCPSCGTKHLKPYHWHKDSDEAVESLNCGPACDSDVGIKFAECAVPTCGTHFSVSGYVEVAIEDEQIPWCVLNYNERPVIMECTRCGKAERIASPDAESDDVLDLLDGFKVKHRSCREGDGSPMRCPICGSRPPCEMDCR